MRLFNSAKEYHAKTKYSYDDVKFIYREFSGESQPPTYKTYSGKPVTDLPKEFSPENLNLREAYHKSSAFNLFHQLKDTSINLNKLSQLLYLTNGVTLVRDFPNQKLFLRAAPSASALYPNEVYLFANKVDGLEVGLYYFQSPQHRLFRIGGPEKLAQIIDAGFGLNSLKDAPLYLFFTSAFSRSSWKFKDRAYRYCLMDAGYMGENLVLAAASLGLSSNLYGDFADQELNDVLGVDGASEAAILTAAVGEEDGPAEKESYTFYMPKPEDDFLDELHKSLVRGIHLLSSHSKQKTDTVPVEVTLPFHKKFENRGKSEAETKLPESKMDFTHNTHKIIEERRSTHNFMRIGITIQELSELLNSLRYVPVLYGFAPHNIYFVANDVTGLENGVYKYHPENHTVEQLRKGTYRGDISYLTLAQDAVFNSSVALFISTDFAEINLFSNRGYRYAHFNVGMYSESIYLSCTALGIGTRGIGNFFDDSINTFFRVNEPDENILGGVILGRF